MAKIITTRDCEVAVNKLTKIYDQKCPGFFVQKTRAGDATFYFHYRDKQLSNKQIDIKVGL